MTEAMKKMIKARSQLIIKQRFFGSLCLKLNLKEDPSCETGWTDGITIGFNADFVVNESMEVLKFFLMHEVGGHVVLLHHLRRKNRDAKLWNVACDYAVNIYLKDSGIVIPDWCLYDAKYDGMTAEGIYAKLLNEEKQKQQENGQNSTSKGQSGKGQGQDKGKQNKTGEIRDFPTKKEVDDSIPDNVIQQESQKWEVATIQAANIAESCGQLPGNMKHIIKEMFDYKVSWQEVLNRFVERRVDTDYSYARTNPRYAAMGMILPSLYTKDVGILDVYIDTSGSINMEDKKQFAGEINAIRMLYRTTVRVVFCDSEVNGEPVIIEPDDDFVSLDSRGGGGTKFAPAIKWSMDQDVQPVCAIYLTDMQCYRKDFGDEPDFPILWIQTKYKRVEPPFGELVHMNPKQY